MSIFSRIAAVASVALFATAAQATVVTYDNWVYNSANQIDWVVTIDDTTAPGHFTFNVEIGDTSGVVGDITGFGFNTSIDYGSEILDNISNVSGTTLSACSSNSCNWNGTAASSPDYAFSVGANGATDFITSFSFSLDSMSTTLTESTFSLVAIRGQSVGNNGASVKDYSATGSTHTVPELSASLAPVSLGLMAGLLLLGFERRRRQV